MDTDTTRQDAWTKDEDLVLAETVLRYIREGKTQLEAFKEVADKLSRTSAACGFRWNATIRQHYQDAIQLAREERKNNNTQNHFVQKMPNQITQQDPLRQAILLLEQLQHFSDQDIGFIGSSEHKQIHQLKQENEVLKQQLTRYREAWREMGKLWEWVEKT